jgi:hypothetical protein
MVIILKALSLLIISVAVIQGIVMLVRGNLKRRFAKGYEIFYEGRLVRILGLFSILLGIVFAFIVFDIVSGVVAIVLFLLIGLPSGVVGIIVQQNGVLIKK